MLEAVVRWPDSIPPNNLQPGTDKQIWLSRRVTYLEYFLVGEKSPRLRPFGHGTGDLLEIGDAPFRAIANK